MIADTEPVPARAVVTPNAPPPSCRSAGQRNRIAGLLAALAVIVAAYWPHSLEARSASLVIDAETGAVLHEDNADVRNYPASLTKLMTLYLVFDALESRRITLETRWRASARAAGQPATKIGLTPGATMTVRQAIEALVVKSANDVATLVAESLGETEARFAALMTAKAQELGMTQTEFRNASGLPDAAQVSTARDLSILARSLLHKHRKYYPFFSTESVTYAGVTHGTHNRMLGNYPGADGMKTGYIRASGFNLVTSAQRGQRRLIGVVLGGRSLDSRDREMMALLDDGFETPAGRGFAVAAAPPKLPLSTAKAPPAPKPARQAAPAVVAAKAPPAAVVGGSADPRPAPTRSADLAGAWGVQVGAYKTERPALDIAKRAREAAGTHLADGEIRIVPLEKPRRAPLYRARIVGIEKTQAYQACTVLRRKNMHCMELSVSAEELAAAN